MNLIERIDKLIPDAYHGTSKLNATNILQARKFSSSSGSDFYLGDGIYFFDGSKDLAEWWAKKQFPKYEIGIIIANIQLGKCLDLTIPEHRNIVKNAKDEFEQKTPEEKITDALVINFICTIIEPEIETIRCIFKQGQLSKIYSGSHIFNTMHIVVCVKRHSNILDFKIVNGGL